MEMEGEGVGSGDGTPVGACVPTLTESIANVLMVVTPRPLAMEAAAEASAPSDAAAETSAPQISDSSCGEVALV